MSGALISAIECTNTDRCFHYLSRFPDRCDKLIPVLPRLLSLSRELDYNNQALFMITLF